jgi:hypothetical protein
MTYRAPLIVNPGASQIQELAVADGLSVAGNVLTGVILANVYLYGNGQPFNGSGGAGSFIASGNSNVAITTPDGPINTTANNVTVVSVNTTGQYVTGIAYASTVMTAPLISATGNIAAGGYVLGNGALLTGVITSVANINNGTSNVSIVSSNANVTVGVNGTANVVTITPTTLIVASSSGNVISTEGNVSAGYFYGNGSLLTGVSSSSNTIFNGNSNVAVSSANANVTISVSTVANVVSISPTTVSVAGNISAGNVSISGNVTVGNISVTGNIVDSGNLSILTGSNGNISLVPSGTGIVTVATNLSVAGNIDVGNVSASGNITGNAAPGSTRTFAVGYMTIPVNNTTSAYTLALADQGELIYNSGTSITVTVPSNANVAFPVGSVVAFAQYSTGTMSIVAQSGVTIALVGTSQVGNRTLAATGTASLTCR